MELKKENHMIKTILQHNHFIKISSCIIGYCLWFFIAQHQSITLTQQAPLCFYQHNSNYTIQAPDSIKVVVSGPRQEVYRLNNALHIDASSYKEGSYLIELTKENLFLPDTIKLLELIPSHVSIEVHKK